MTEVWYRFEDHRTAPPLDEWEQPCGPSGVHVTLFTYDVVRHTPKGVWLTLFGSSGRFCRGDAKKRFACPTITEAAESFRARKNRQISILKHQIRDAEKALEVLEKTKWQTGHNDLTKTSQWIG